MPFDLTQLAPLILVSPLLVVMAVNDLKHLRISNRLVLCILAVFLITAPLLLPLQELGYRAIAGIATFMIGVFGFAFRLWGGGDVKAIAALVLFVPSSSYLPYAYAFSASLFIGMFLVVTSRSAFGSPQSCWSALRPKAGYPMGVSIAMSGFLFPLFAILLSGPFY